MFPYQTTMLKVKTLSTRLLYTTSNSSWLASKTSQLAQEIQELLWLKRKKEKSILSLKLSLLSMRITKYSKLDTISTGSLFPFCRNKEIFVFSLHVALVLLSHYHNALFAPILWEWSMWKVCGKESSFNSNPTSTISSGNLKRHVIAILKFMCSYNTIWKQYGWKDTALRCPRIQYYLFRQVSIHTSTLRSISEKIPDSQYKVWVDTQINQSF